MQPKFLDNLTTSAGIKDGIKWIRTTGQKFDNYVHLVACAIVVHAKDHGDCSHALSLVQAMPKSARRAALIRWFTAFSPISVTLNKDDGKSRVGLRKVGSANYNEFNVDGARANPYYDWDKAEDNALAALLGLGDFNENIIRLADRMDKQLKDGKVKDEDRAAFEKRIKDLRKVCAAA